EALPPILVGLVEADQVAHLRPPVGAGPRLAERLQEIEAAHYFAQPLHFRLVGRIDRQSGAGGKADDDRGEEAEGAHAALLRDGSRRLNCDRTGGRRAAAPRADAGWCAASPPRPG